MIKSNPLLSILDKNRLTGPNFVDWSRNLRIVLSFEHIAYVLEKALPASVADDASDSDRVAYQKWKADDLLARCYMLAFMSNELQKQHEKMTSAFDILLHLQALYGEQSQSVRYQISKNLFHCRMAENSSVQEHGLKMIRYIEQLDSLGVHMDGELCTDLVLQSLPDSFSQFVTNFYMRKMKVSLPELLSMLRTAEETIRKVKWPILQVDQSSGSRKGEVVKRKGKAKKKTMRAKGRVQKQSLPVSNEKGHCFHCGKLGHWKRNCKVYLSSIGEPIA